MDRSPTNSQQNDHENQRQLIGSKGGSSFGDGTHSAVISHTESKRRKRGEPVIIQRQIFFDGVVYQIEEELYSDSDHSSVYTSEDDFEVDRNLQGRFKRANPLLEDENKFDEDMISETIDGDVTPLPTQPIVEFLGSQYDEAGRISPLDAKTAEVL